MPGRDLKINHQPDATAYQFIILTFVYSSTCFGSFSAHHQELNECSGSLWVYLCIVNGTRGLIRAVSHSSVFL
jgi:hypothetical protein